MKTMFTKNFLLTSLLLVASSLCVKAQFVCYDVQPDSVVFIPNGSSSQISMNIDLNFDNVPDFQFTSVQSGFLGFVIAQANQVGLNNFVLTDGAGNALALTAGTNLDASSTTWHPMNTTNPQMMIVNNGVASGTWAGQIDKYIGLRFLIGTNTHYGWARFTFSNNSNMYTLKDFGYNATVNGAIPAGQACSSYTPTFTTFGSACPGGTIYAQVSNTATANSYSWSSTPATGVFGSANSSTTTVTFPSAGNYTLTLSATQGTNVGTYSQIITVNPAPTVLVSSSHSVLCSGQTATLTASGGLVYNWSTSQSGSSIAVSPTVTTTYSVTAYNNFSCSATAMITQSVAVCGGIAQMGANLESFAVYPNPASETLFIGTTAGTSIDVNVEILDVFGKTLVKQLQRFNSAEKTNSVNITHLPEGIYFVKITSSLGESQLVRIVKH